MSKLEDFQHEILSWDFSSSIESFQKRGLTVASSEKCVSIPNRFLTASEYISAFRRPAILEFQAGVLHNVSTENLQAYPVSVQAELNGQRCTELVARFIEKEAPLITGDMLCAISMSRSLTDSPCILSISLGGKIPGGVKLKAMSSHVAAYITNPSQTYFLHLVASMISCNREMEALHAIASIPLREEILLGIGNATPNHSSTSPPLPPALLAAFSNKLNSSQKGIIDTLCDSDKTRVLLVQGPPGTGKTMVLNATLNAIHVQQYNAYYSAVALAVKSGKITTNERSWLELTRVSKPRIIVCAPSNVAIDNIILRIQADKFLDGNCRQYVPRLVRIGKGSLNNAQVADRALSRLIEKLTRKSGKEIVEKVSKLESLYSEYRHGVLVQVSKLVCLLSGTPHAFKLGIETRVTTNKAGSLVPYWADHGSKTTSVQLPPVAEPEEAHSPPVEEFEEWILFSKELMKYIELWEETHWKLQRYKLVQNFIQKSLGTAPEKFQLNQHLETLFMNQASIVCGTLNAAGLFQVRESLPFQTCVVDEAAQAVELSTLIPLSLGVKQLVLVGDPNQLPATILGNRDLMGNYERSLFERLQYCGVPIHTLNVQYRMNPAISEFPSKKFYNGKLENADSVYTVPFFSQPPFNLNPFVFFDLIDARDQVSAQMGRSNIDEATVCVSLYFALLRIAGTPLSVGVISPYAEQVRLLKSAFDNASCKDIEIATVDSFQGKEKDIIILSTVRTCSEANTVGFLADVRRMNVAITRAKHGLFIVGNANALSINPQWNELIQQAKRVHRGYIRVPDANIDVWNLL